MTILKHIVVKNGSYTTRDGAEKNRWLTIGQLHEAKDGGQYVTLDAHINLAALPRKDGDTRVTASFFDPRKDGEKPAPAGNSAPDFDSEIPF